MPQAVVTLPDGQRAKVTFEDQEQLDKTVSDLVAQHPVKFGHMDPSTGHVRGVNAVLNEAIGEPAMQALPPAHALPQRPQLALSLAGSTQDPEHASCPLGQVAPSLPGASGPASGVAGDGQSRPSSQVAIVALPQLAASATNQQTRHSASSRAGRNGLSRASSRPPTISSATSVPRCGASVTPLCVTTT